MSLDTMLDIWVITYVEEGEEKEYQRKAETETEVYNFFITRMHPVGCELVSIVKKSIGIDFKVI